MKHFEENDCLAGLHAGQGKESIKLVSPDTFRLIRAAPGSDGCLAEKHRKRPGLVFSCGILPYAARPIRYACSGEMP